MKPLLTLVAAALALASGYSSAQTTVGGCKIEPKANCAKAVMRRAQLANMDLSGADLSGANLQEVRGIGHPVRQRKSSGDRLSLCRSRRG